MVCHIVPKTYLKSWKHDNSNSIYVFKRNSISCEIKNITNLVDTGFASEDEYLLDIYECSKHNKFISIFEDIFKKVNRKFQLIFTGNYIDSAISFMHIIKNFSDTSKISVIERSSGNMYSVRKTKIFIEQIWKQDVEKLIENFFNITYENKWIEFKKYLILYKSADIDLINYYDYLVEFLAIQKLRIKENTENINGNIIDIMKKIFNFNKISIDGIDTKLLFIVHIYDYVRYKEQHNNNFKNNYITNHINLFSNQNISFFLLNSDDEEFITTDNPYIVINNRKNYLEEYSGLYFPISPNCCLYGCTCEEKNKYNLKVINIKKDITRYINYILKSEANTHYISSKKDVSKMFSSSITKGLFNEILLSIGMIEKI